MCRFIAVRLLAAEMRNFETTKTDASVTIHGAHMMRLGMPAPQGVARCASGASHNRSILRLRWISRPISANS